MRQAILRWTVYLSALLVAGPLAGLTTAWLRAPDGGTHATPILSADPGLGVAAALGAVAIASAMGLLGARLLGVKAGMSTAGLVLAWAAWRTGTVDQVIRSYHSPGVLWRLALEGLIFGAAGLLVVLLLAALGRPDPHTRPDGSATPDTSPPLRVWSFAPLPMAAGLVAGAAAAWAVAQEPLKGQAVAAAIVGALAAAAAARLVDYRAPFATLAVPIALLAVLGPLSAVVVGAGSSGTLLRAGRNGQLFPLANIMPLDWIAGGLLGIPLGVAWAGSLLDKRVEGKA